MSLKSNIVVGGLLREGCSTKQFFYLESYKFPICELYT